jgi:hypothetical protein
MALLVSEDKLRKLIREQFKFIEGPKSLEYAIDIIIEECKKSVDKLG